jgi:hypothetical protein
VAASSKTKWYKDLFIPALERQKKRFNTVEKKKEQIKIIWPHGDWERMLDPGKFALSHEVE